MYDHKGHALDTKYRIFNAIFKVFLSYNKEFFCMILQSVLESSIKNLSTQNALKLDLFRTHKYSSFRHAGVVCMSNGGGAFCM